jgi:hypothetical protein
MRPTAPITLNRYNDSIPPSECAAMQSILVNNIPVSVEPFTVMFRTSLMVGKYRTASVSITMYLNTRPSTQADQGAQVGTPSYATLLASLLVGALLALLSVSSLFFLGAVCCSVRCVAMYLLHLVHRNLHLSLYFTTLSAPSACGSGNLSTTGASLFRHFGEMCPSCPQV